MRATHCRFRCPPCTGTQPRSALVGDAPTRGWASNLPALHTSPRTPQRGLAAVLGGMRSGSSDLLLRPVSSQPVSSSALLNPFEGYTQPAEHRASAGLWPGREYGKQTGIADRRGNVSLPMTSCLVSPWYDQTCTVSGPAPGSSAASLWPFCCPQICHLEWLLDSGYGSCRDNAEGGYAKEPQYRVDGSIVIPVPQSCQFPLEARCCSTGWSHV